MFDLINEPMRLKYVAPNNGAIIDAGPVKFEEDWYDNWLESMVMSGEDIIFFLTTESTDVFEPLRLTFVPYSFGQRAQSES